MHVRIRKYQGTDREGIRAIAASTARGCHLSDLRLLADVLTDYYIFYEPEHILVAERESEILGYLLGCFNTMLCRRIKAGRVIPRAVLKALPRAKIGRREFKYLALSLSLSIQKKHNSNPPAEYPAHFHINVKKKARGMGIGAKLVGEFLMMLRKAGVKGVHVRVRENDRRAREFFKKFGFARQSGYPALIAEKEGIRTSRTVIYAKTL